MDRPADRPRQRSRPRNGMTAHAAGDTAAFTPGRPMNILQRVFDSLMGPMPVADPETVARETIRSAGFSDTVRSQALARFDRRMDLRQPVDESLHAVMAWAESRHE